MFRELASAIGEISVRVALYLAITAIAFPSMVILIGVGDGTWWAFGIGLFAFGFAIFESVGPTYIPQWFSRAWLLGITGGMFLIGLLWAIGDRAGAMILGTLISSAAFIPAGAYAFTGVWSTKSLIALGTGATQTYEKAEEAGIAALRFFVGIAAWEVLAAGVVFLVGRLMSPEIAASLMFIAVFLAYVTFGLNIPGAKWVPIAICWIASIVLMGILIDLFGKLGNREWTITSLWKDIPAFIRQMRVTGWFNTILLILAAGGILTLATGKTVWGQTSTTIVIFLGVWLAGNAITGWIDNPSRLSEPAFWKFLPEIPWFSSETAAPSRAATATHSLLRVAIWGLAVFCFVIFFWEGLAKKKEGKEKNPLSYMVKCIVVTIILALAADWAFVQGGIMKINFHL